MNFIFENVNLEQLESEIEHLSGNEATEESRERKRGGGEREKRRERGGRRERENCKIGIIPELFLLNSVSDQ